MKKRGRLSALLGSAFFAALLSAMPAAAQDDSIETQIKALEAEVQKIEPLKEQIDRLRSQQIELKKEATSAAAALPTFEYRPGRGLIIAAADKSWSWQTSFRSEVFMYNWTGGAEGESGLTKGELFGRRVRWYNNLCWKDCFYELIWSIDSDSGNIPLELQDQEFSVHFEQLNPYFPTLSLGLEVGGVNGLERSSASGSNWEISNVLSNSSVSSTGKFQGIALNWTDVPVGPGTATLSVNYVSSGLMGISNGENRASNKKGFEGEIEVKPFSRIKNKWIQDLAFAVTTQMNSVSLEDDASSFRRQRLRNSERRSRLAFIEASGIGEGLHYWWSPSLQWRIGPYTLRAKWDSSRWEGEKDAFRGVKATGWQVAHGLFVWSPKGFLTGSTSTPNSVQMGWMFERADMQCAKTRAQLGAGDCTPGAGSFFNSNTVTSRELALHYYITRGFRLGMGWNWWRVDNTTAANQDAVGCRKQSAGADPGKQCDFHTVNLALQWQW